MEKLNHQLEQTILRFARQRESNRRLWNIGQETVNFLTLLIKIHQPKMILEIGTSNGFSAFWMSVAVQDQKGMIETIECDLERYNLAIENLSGRDNIRLHLGKAEEIIPTLNTGYDFVFLDANKEQYHLYLELLMPKLTKQALIVADNILSHKHSTRQYSEKLASNPAFLSVDVPIDSGLKVTLYNPLG